MPATLEPPTTPNISFQDLLKKSQRELDDLFQAAQPGPIPEGDSQGQAIVCPGSFWSKLIARFVHHLGWQGKVFTKNADGHEATLVNKIGPAGTPLIVARVYYTESWLDGKKCIILDYSKTSLFARRIRDEIREIAPRLYLGKVWWGKKFLIHFALQFPK